MTSTPSPSSPSAGRALHQVLQHPRFWHPEAGGPDFPGDEDRLPLHPRQQPQVPGAQQPLEPGQRPQPPGALQEPAGRGPLAGHQDTAQPLPSQPQSWTDPSFTWLPCSHSNMGVCQLWRAKCHSGSESADCFGLIFGQNNFCFERLFRLKQVFWPKQVSFSQNIVFWLEIFGIKRSILAEIVLFWPKITALAKCRFQENIWLFKGSYFDFGVLAKNLFRLPTVQVSNNLLLTQLDINLW